MTYHDYLLERLLKHADYLRVRYGGTSNAPPEEVQRLVDYTLDLANFGAVNIQGWRSAGIDIQKVDSKTIPEDWTGRLKWYAQRRAAQKVQAALRASRAKLWRV